VCSSAALKKSKAVAVPVFAGSPVNKGV